MSEGRDRRHGSAPAREVEVATSRESEGARSGATARLAWSAHTPVITVPVLDTVSARGAVALLRQALAEEPAAVVCDLSGVARAPEPEAAAGLDSLVAEILEWPVVPLFVVCPDTLLCQRFARHGENALVRFFPSLFEALQEARQAHPVETVRVSLDPRAESVKAARDLVRQVCDRWGFTSQSNVAALVVSEMVTNAVLHAATDLELTMARHGPLLRLAVRDAEPRVPAVRPPDLSSITGRGMLLVGAVSRAWGVLPTAEPGKVVWAVLEGRSSS